MEGGSLRVFFNSIITRLDIIQQENLDIKKEVHENTTKQINFQNHMTEQLEGATKMLKDYKEHLILLENKFPEIIKLLQQEKTFMRDQVSGAQREIIGRLTEINTKMTDYASVSSSVVSENNKLLHRLSQSVHEYSDTVFEIGAKLDILELDDKINELKVELIKVRESSDETKTACRHIEHIFDTKLSQYFNELGIKLDSCISHVQRVPDVVKRVTNDTLVGLDNYLGKRNNDNLRTCNRNLQLMDEVNVKLGDLQNILEQVNKEMIAGQQSLACSDQQLAAGLDKLDGKLSESFLLQEVKLHFKLNKVRDTILESTEKTETYTLEQLTELRKNYDLICNLQKQIDVFCNQSMQLKDMNETNRTTSLETATMLRELREDVNRLGLDVSKHFKKRLHEEQNITSEQLVNDICEQLRNYIKLLSDKIGDDAQAVKCDLKTHIENNSLFLNKTLSELKTSTEGNPLQLNKTLSEIKIQLKGISSSLNKTLSQLKTHMEGNYLSLNKKLSELNGPNSNTFSYVSSLLKDFEAVKHQIKNVETLANNIQKSVNTETILVSKHHSEALKQQEQSLNNIITYIDRTKYEIWAMTEKEAQLVRDRIEGPLPSHGKYTFDFYVLNFQSLVQSGKIIASLPWHINEAKYCARGCVVFHTRGHLHVYLVHGRHPECVGLQPVTGGRNLKVTATICDIKKKILPELKLGEKTCGTDETGIRSHIHLCNGTHIGMTSCHDLVRKGYGNKEAYSYGAILIRYSVIVT